MLNEENIQDGVLETTPTTQEGILNTLDVEVTPVVDVEPVVQTPAYVEPEIVEAVQVDEFATDGIIDVSPTFKSADYKLNNKIVDNFLESEADEYQRMVGF